MFDIVLKDAKASHPAVALYSKEKENIELLGQYDGQPNKYNEKILSLDVEKILYYIGLGKLVTLDCTFVVRRLANLCDHNFRC